MMLEERDEGKLYGGIIGSASVWLRIKKLGFESDYLEGPGKMG
jgi:hypothetical protein